MGLSFTRQATPQHLLLQLKLRSAVNTWTTAEASVWGGTESVGNLGKGVKTACCLGSGETFVSTSRILKDKNQKNSATLLT